MGISIYRLRISKDFMATHRSRYAGHKTVDQVQASTLTYWTETFSLFAFGVASIVAGKVIPALVDEDERLKLSLNQ